MRVLGISGSLRRDSLNSALLRAAAERLPAGAELVEFDRLREVPPYDEDVEVDATPAVVEALRRLPGRQREAIVLRYYADLSEAEIATTMKISRGAVKSHTARGMTALRAALEQE